MRPKVGDMVRVTWEDATTMRAGWHSIPEARRQVRRLTRAWSVGYVVAVSRRRLVLAANCGEEGLVAEVTTIPRSSIRKLRVLRCRS